MFSERSDVNSGRYARYEPASARAAFDRYVLYNTDKDSPLILIAVKRRHTLSAFVFFFVIFRVRKVLGIVLFSSLVRNVLKLIPKLLATSVAF